MRIVVIGSDSFIAKRYIDFVHDKIDSIIGISRVGSSVKNELFIPDFSTIPESVFQGADVIINFSAIVHRPDIKDESIYDDVNYRLTILNAQKAKRAGVGLFIQMSTIAVYGGSQYIDEHTICCPNTPYGSSKLKADIELLSMLDDVFKVAIVRPPMVYGAIDAPGNMLRLIKLVRLKLPLPFGNANCTRDFIHIKNLTQYLGQITINQLSGVFILSDHQPVSTNQLIRIIAKYLDRKVLLINMPRFLQFFFRFLFKTEYNKLFGGQSVFTNFPKEDDITRYSVEDGIREMVL
ncbi:MAG: NAD-dependent epimerase/dehydratase family protein [Bacteroidia bacterium]|nr:NAD-dependent epimerase/dehydratase family protein [Bacteroidia bacterium]